MNISHTENNKNINLKEFSLRMSEAIPKALDKNKDHRTFDSTRDGHIVKFITGIIQHFGALTLEEISFILGIFDLSHDEIRIRQFIRSAQFLDWLAEDDRGTVTFYVAMKPRDAIEYRLVAGSPKIDKSAWRAQVRDYWRQHEPERFAAIRSAAAKM